MSKLTKNQKSVAEKVELGKAYTLTEASKLVKEITTTKFDASVDVDIRLGVDPRKANQMVRGVVTLPNGTGKQTRVLCLCTPDQESAAKEAGADYVGLDEYIQKINAGWTDVDVIITMPSCMGKVGPLGRVLGPRGLMPNPKSGTVTMDVAKAVKEVKSGKIDFKVDKAYECTKELLSLEQKPTAIFTSNNLTTMGCLKYLTENNIKLGKDISVLGFDDIDALKMIGYNISVVSRDAGLQGEEAMELLQERFIKRDGIDGKQVMVPYRIILRGSEKCEK
mgnify:CR=1 FL=1